MLELKNVTKSFENNKIFDDFCINFTDKSVTAIMGASGTGKTTLLNIIAGLTPYEGEIIGADGDVSYVFQSPRLISGISVVKNVEFVLTRIYPDKAERRAAALRYLRECEIEQLKDKLPTEISGGEGQRVQLARAFAYPASLILMDEPFSSLDVALKMRLMSLCADFFEKSPRTAVIVTHDVDEALTIADCVVVLKRGGAKRFEIPSPRAGRTLTGGEVNAVREKIYAALLG